METKECPTGKIGYSSPDVAKNALWVLRFYGIYWRKSTRTYQCKTCGGWHLTKPTRNKIKSELNCTSFWCTTD